MAKKEKEEASLVSLDEKGVLTVAEGVTEIGLPDVSQFYPTDIKKVVLPKGLKTIGSSVFAYCTNLKGVALPSSVEKIEAGAFSYSGIEKIDIPEGVKLIKESTFEGCEKLESVKFPKSIRNIDKRAFKGCKALKGVSIKALSETSMPNNWLRISENSFVESGLEEIEIETTDGVSFASSYGDYDNCFSGTPLRQVVVKGKCSGLKFRECMTLEKVDLGEQSLTAHEILNMFGNRKDIYKHIVNGCDLYRILRGGSLKFDEKDVEERLETDENFVYDKKEKKAISCREEARKSLKELKLKDGYSIGFRIDGFDSLESLDLDAGLCGSEGMIAIENCPSLEVVKTTCEADSLLIKGCEKLKTIDIGSGLKKVSIENCGALEKLSAPSSVFELLQDDLPWLALDVDIDIYKDGSKYDGLLEFDGTFLIRKADPFERNDKTKLLYCKRSRKEVVIPEGIEDVSERRKNQEWFSQFGDGVEKVVVPKSYKGFRGNSVIFQNLKGLKSIELPRYEEGEKTANDRVCLDGCTSLKEVTLPSWVHSFSANGTDMEIKVEGDNLTFDGTILFNHDRRIVYYIRDSAENVVIPEGVTDIYCELGENLKKLTLPSTLNHISGFKNCDADIEIAEGNEYLAYDNGVLYEKERGWLLHVKNGVRDLVIPKEVKGLYHLFAGSLPGLKTITFMGVKSDIVKKCDYERLKDVEAVYMKPAMMKKVKETQLMGSDGVIFTTYNNYGELYKKLRVIEKKGKK